MPNLGQGVGFFPNLTRYQMKLEPEIGNGDLT